MVADILSIADQASFRYAYGILSLCLKIHSICKGGLSDGDVKRGLVIL